MSEMEKSKAWEMISQHFAYLAQEADKALKFLNANAVIIDKNQYNKLKNNFDSLLYFVKILIDDRSKASSLRAEAREFVEKIEQEQAISAAEKGG